MSKLPQNMTIGEAYGPAVEVQTEEEARIYFEKLVERQIRFFDKSREEAQEQERMNIGYYAGYYDAETRNRVERLYKFAVGPNARQPVPHASTP